MEFRILGTLEVRDGERTVPLAGRKPRALLGVLLLHANEIVSTTRLTDELWGEQPPSRARKLVQGYVHGLRKELDGDLVTRPPGYLLRVEPHALDLHEFGRLTEQARAAEPREAVELWRRALALWRGPPLGDIVLEGPTRHEIGRLSELHLSARIGRVQAELDLGHHDQLVGELESLVASHPYQEDLHGLLMLALYRSGRQAEALAAYRSLRAMLAAELGLEPGQKLRDLEAAILRQDATLVLGRPGVADGAATEQKASPEPPEKDELRHITVLLADVTGAGALRERLVGADVEALVADCLMQMGKAVEEYGGTVGAVADDGIHAYFGVPRTHEDDPERAAWSALRILDVIGAYTRDIAQAWGIPALGVRVGIDTVRAPVRDVGPRNSAASRVRAAAPPGAIAVGEGTARRLAHRFALEPLDAPGVLASTLIGPQAPSRAATLRPLVGRDCERARLDVVVSELASGRGQALLLVGDPGIGKTRLLRELRTRIPEPVPWLEGHCVSHGGPPSWPFAEALRRWLGVEAGDAEIILRTRIRARLAPLFGSDQEPLLSALAWLLGVRPSQVGETGVHDAEAATAARRAYCAWIEVLTAQTPVVLAVEDVHWAHATTRELAEDLLRLTDEAPLLLVATLRREPDSEGWRFRSRVLGDFSHRATELTVERLPDEESRRLLATLLPGAFDNRTREELVARAEGNPLYLEELLRALIEGGGLEQRHRTWTTTLRPSLLLPPALENLLVARIDRLPEGVRGLAQLAAVIGREFPVPVLERAADGAVGDDLGGMLRAEIAREVRRYPELVCAFRHGLLQDAALSTLTPASRRELYGRVARAFEDLYEGSLDDHLERLAHYHAQAGETARASHYVARAASRASADRLSWTSDGQQ